MLGELFQQDATLDGKGRLVLPARLRRKLEVFDIHSLYLLYLPGMAIFAFTPDEWKRQVESRLQDQDPFNPRMLAFAHGILANGARVDIDRQGRILIPPKLRQKAGLEREVVVQAFLGRLEIWDAGRWARREAEAEAEVPSLGGMPVAPAGGAA